MKLRYKYKRHEIYQQDVYGDFYQIPLHGCSYGFILHHIVSKDKDVWNWGTKICNGRTFNYKPTKKKFESELFKCVLSKAPYFNDSNNHIIF